MKDFQSPQLPYRLTAPPRAIRKARMDNIAIVPASIFGEAAKYKECKRRANCLPRGSVFILSPANARLKKILDSAASFFKGHGHPVMTMPAGRIAV